MSSAGSSASTRLTPIREHLSAFRWSDAEQAVREHLRAHPGDSDAHFLLGESLREQWRLDDAATSYSLATTLNPSNAEAAAGFGFVQIARGRLDDGITNCRRAIHLRSDLSAPHRYIASALLAQRLPQRAAASALEARRLAPLQAENLIVLAAAWFRCDLRPAALRLIDIVVRDFPARAEVWVVRASFRMAGGDAVGAAADLEQGLRLKPWLPPAHALAARLHAAQRRMPDAFAAIRRARGGNPASEEFLTLEADWLAASGDRAGALSLIEAEWWRHPRSRELRARAAMLMLETGRVDDALRHVSGLFPGATIAQVWKRLAEVWIDIGPHCDERVLACLTRAGEIREGQTDDETRWGQAEVLARLGRHQAAFDSSSLRTPASIVFCAEQLERLNRPDEAASLLAEGIQQFPADALCVTRLGALMRARREYDAAGRHLRRAVELAPEDGVAAEQLAILLSDTSELDAAMKMFRRAAELLPALPSIRMNIAVLLARQKRWIEAEHAFRQIVQSDQFSVSALGKLGHVLAEQKRWGEAVEVFEHAVEFAPNDTGLRLSLVNALRAMHQVDAAVEVSRRWIDDAPTLPVAWSCLARQLAARRDPEADSVAEKAWTLEPDSVQSIEMRADVAGGRGRYREAIEWIERGLAKEPDHAGLLSARALARQEVEPIERADADMRRVLALAPEADASKMNFALFALRRGLFGEGWRYYESRESAMRSPVALLTAKEAAGGALDLTRASVLVRAEQGLGDTFQFMRYATKLAAEAREVVFQLQDAIVWAARGLGPNVRVYGYQERVPSTDYQTSLISLPAYYATDEGRIPRGVPYVAADVSLVEQWRERIGNHGFRIGVVWQTNPAHGNARRWIPLKFVAPLAEIPGVRLISLQKFHGLEQLEALPNAQSIETLGEKFDERVDAFADAAAVIANLDLVISIDTSMAHLAGAMGRPTWVLLHTGSDWRWLTGRNDSPWYPTVRLFRQENPDDWSTVGEALRARCLDAASGAGALWPADAGLIPSRA